MEDYKSSSLVRRYDRESQRYSIWTLHRYPMCCYQTTFERLSFFASESLAVIFIDHTVP